MYGGIAPAEVRAAKAVSQAAGVTEHRIFRMPDLREASDMPGSDFGELPPTYIPVRNSIFYAVAASIAEETGSWTLIGGHNRNDSEVFEDTRTEFFELTQKALRAGSSRLRAARLELVRPLSKLRKHEVIRLAVELGVPLGQTWSCHRDGPVHCGGCAGCLGRKEAFERAGVSDEVSADFSGIGRKTS
jgi:7-cyano-7-deazaguanine synthase